AQYEAVVERVVAGGMAVSAGHDLDLDNLPIFRELPHLAEVSIGHALISRAIFVGLDRVVREYLAVLAQTGAPPCARATPGPGGQSVGPQSAGGGASRP